MNKLSASLVFCVASIVSVSANAVPITFTDTTNFTSTDAVDSVTGVSDLNDYGSGDVNYLQTSMTQALAGDFDYVTWTHQFSFDPALDYIVDGSLSLTFSDDTDAGLLSTEFAFGFAEDGTWGFGEVDTATYDFDVSASFLEDGLFSVTVASILGDFYIDSSALTITYEPAVVNASVPEPSSLAMLGGALIVFGLMHGLRRRKSHFDGGSAYSI